MRHDRDPGALETVLLGALFGQVDERRRGHDNHGNAPSFEFSRVAETPRRAAASIGGAGEDEIRLTDQGLQ
jgi:hypothetical protein